MNNELRAAVTAQTWYIELDSGYKYPDLDAIEEIVYLGLDDTEFVTMTIGDICVQMRRSELLVALMLSR